MADPGDGFGPVPDARPNTAKRWKAAIKKRLDVVEKIFKEGIDSFNEQFRVVLNNQKDLIEHLDKQDVAIATLRHLCVKKGMFTDEEFDGHFQVLTEMKAKHYEALRKKVEEAQQEEEAKEEEPPADPVAAEMLGIANRGKVAGEDTGLPDDAFIYGG